MAIALQGFYGAHFQASGERIPGFPPSSSCLFYLSGQYRNFQSSSSLLLPLRQCRNFWPFSSSHHLALLPLWPIGQLFCLRPARLPTVLSIADKVGIPRSSGDSSVKRGFQGRVGIPVSRMSRIPRSGGDSSVERSGTGISSYQIIPQADSILPIHTPNLGEGV